MVLVATACGGVDGPKVAPSVKTIAVTLSVYQILVGATAQGRAAMFDAQGSPVLDRVPVWSSATPGVVGVSATGVVTGLEPGIGTVRATSGAVVGEAQVVVSSQRAGSIKLSLDSATVFIPTGSVQLVATVKDSLGDDIANPIITWASSAPLIATVNSTGLVVGIAGGTATIRATVDGKTALAIVAVKVTPNPLAPQVGTINPAVMRPGGTYALVGNNFAPVGANTVLVDGVQVTVTQATATAMSITLPLTGFSCEPSRAVFVQVTANGLIGGGNGTISVPNPRALAPGQSVIISNASEVRCNELVNTGSRYVVSVYNAYRTTVQPGLAGTATLTVRGAAGAPSVGSVSSAARRPAPEPWNGAIPRIGSAAFDMAEAVRRARERDQVHSRLLERNADYLRTNAVLLASLRSRRPGPGGRLASGVGTQVATIGAITQLKVANIDAGAQYCSVNIPIGVRTVFVGQHTIIVEDTISVLNGKATLQGQMNSYFTQLGQEFDTVMWPILVNNFGNPLALDDKLSATGKVVMVFSPRVNAFQSGDVLGFAVTCDFLPVAQAPSSNVGEYFYAAVPTDAAAGFASSGTRDSWLRLIRATLIHEVKHVTAFAERISRFGAGSSLEDPSWEEGMARNVEELYARTFYLTQPKQNGLYAASIRCEALFIRGEIPAACANRPLLMLRHFDGLETYFGLPESYTPLGRSFASDATIYASAWAVERWANDHFAANESQFLKDFTTSSATGVPNVEGRTGRPWEEMLGEWSLGMYLDDEPGFTPENPHLKMLSWNLHDIWLGLCSDLGPCTNSNNISQLYPRPSPFQLHPLQFGTFSINGSIVGGSFTILELTGTQVGKQLIELRSTIGGDPPPTVRLAIVRVQ